MRTFLKDLRWGKFILLRGDMISNYASNYGEWCETEVDLYKRLLRKDSNVLEIGANMGLHTIPLSAICHAGTIICFEPQPPIYNILCGNIALNNRLNVFAYNKAVGEYNGFINIPVSSYDKPWNYGSFSIENGYNREGDYVSQSLHQSIEIVSIDSALKNSPLNIDFIKIDVEGHEMKCLQGAVETIMKSRPTIFCEAVEKDVTEKVAIFLGHLGYDGYWFLNNRYRSDNFLACPIQMYNKLSYDINIIYLHSADTSPSAESCRRQLVKYNSFDQLTKGLPILSSFI